MSIYKRFHMECDGCENEFSLTIQDMGARDQRRNFRKMAERCGWSSIEDQATEVTLDYCQECSARRKIKMIDCDQCGKQIGSIKEPIFVDSVSGTVCRRCFEEREGHPPDELDGQIIVQKEKP